MTAQGGLTAPLYVNGGIIMTTDPANIPAGTVSNGGILMEAA